MPNWILKDAAAIIATPICHLFNSSLRDSYIPTLWKSAKVCPLPKTKPMQNISKDLRPISLTPVLTKMLEHYSIQHMINTCQVVDPNQFGAVKGSSTTFVLLEILQPVYQAIHHYRNYARVLLIDFSKAFDHIDHQILLHNLDKNGVHPIVQHHSFLQGRQRQVKIGKSFSDWNSVNSGVPQGTLSGPELFIHMLSDFVTEAKNVKFVDDSTLVTIGRNNLKSDSMQRATDQTAKWSKENKLGINATKTNEKVDTFWTG